MHKLEWVSQLSVVINVILLYLVNAVAVAILTLTMILRIFVQV